MKRKWKAKYRFSRKCHCEAVPVLRTCTSNDNLGDNVGRKYYMCKGGGCTMLKWWDNAMMEEVQEIKAEKSELKDRLWYMNTYSRNDVNHLHLLSLAVEEHYEEMKSKVEEIVKQDLRVEVQKSVAAMKKMKMLTIFAVLMALVVLAILLFK